MEKTEQLKSILTDLDNRELTKHQAHDLICVLFSVSDSHECKFYVNADWTYLNCKCGKRIEPSED